MMCVIEVVEFDWELEEFYWFDYLFVNENGMIYVLMVNVEEEMVEMMEFSCQYQNIFEVILIMWILMVCIVWMGG